MNVSRVSPLSFKGVYRSNSLNPGAQFKRGKEIQESFNKSGLAKMYEEDGKDILIEPGPGDSVNVVFVPHDIKRLNDDNYSRWHGSY